MFTQYSTQALSKKADDLVTKIALFSSLDRVRMQELETELAVIQMILIDRMSDENDRWLHEQLNTVWSA